jgi:two-component sensor histidine kinase
MKLPHLPRLAGWRRMNKAHLFARPPAWISIPVGMFAAFAALGLRLALAPFVGNGDLLISLFPVLLIVGLVLDIVGSVACLIVAILGEWYLFMGEPLSFRLADHEAGVLIGSSIAGALVILICSTLRTAARALQRSAAQERVLMREMEHRLKNTLTLIGSLSRRTYTEGRPLNEAQADFQGRLAALAHAHEAMLGDSAEICSLRALVVRTLEPFGYAEDDARFAIEGRDLRLIGKAATTLALALHELATNAAKYGALSVPRGRVEIAWKIDDQPRPHFVFRWREYSGPAVTAPTRRGFGSELIERNVAGQLQGRSQIDFAAEGVRAEITAPARSIAAA